MAAATPSELRGTPSTGDLQRCPHCGASNPAAAQWCGQCYARFVAPEPPPPPLEAVEEEVALESRDEAQAMLSELASEGDPTTAPPPPASARTPAGSSSKSSGSFSVGTEGISWTCGRCDSVNDFSHNECSVCGASFADAIKPPEKPLPPRDPNTAAMVSLFLPGAGHAYIGLWGQAIARAVISTWVVAVAIICAAQSAPQARILGVLFGLVAVGLWVTGAHDAYREASNQSRFVLLKQRFFLHLVLGLLVVSVFMIFALALGARPA